MKRLLVIACWLALCKLCCAQSKVAVTVPEDSVRMLCEYMVGTYPKATLQDLYKTCYQDFFGAEHIMQDTAAARTYLRHELDELRHEDVNESGMPMREPTGFRHRYERINLVTVLTGGMSEESLWRLFTAAAGKDNALHTHWADEWAQIEAIALQVHPAWQDSELQALLRQAAANKQAVHHSPAFRNAYKPHYRIIPTKQ